MFLNGNKGNCSKQKDIDEIGSKFGFNNWLEFVVVILFLVVVVVIVVVDDADVVVVDDNVLDVDDNVLVVDVNVVAVVVVFVVYSVFTSFFVVSSVLVEGSELVLSIVVDFSRFFNTSPIHVLKNPIFV